MNSCYRPVQPLGTGGSGNVYQATQVSLDRTVAVKQLHDLRWLFPHLDAQQVLSRLQHEVRQAARLSHPNIVPIQEAATDQAPPWIVYEFVEGESLRKVLESGAMSPDRAIQVFLQVLHALRYAHRHNVVHGGLKPENVIIDPMGNARVTDFGLGLLHTLGARPPLHVDTGPIAYLAPEAYTDPWRVGPQVDLFALGILLYETLSGRIPGRRAPLPTKLHKDLSPAFDQIFDRLTLDDPAERYQSVDQVLEDCDYSDVKSPMRGPNASFFFDRLGEQKDEQKPDKAPKS